MEASVDSYDYDSGDMHRRASELNDGKIRKRVLVLTEGVMVRDVPRDRRTLCKEGQKVENRPANVQQPGGFRLKLLDVKKI